VPAERPAVTAERFASFFVAPLAVAPTEPAPPARPPRRPPVVRDLTKLHPAFQPKIEGLLEALEALGTPARLWETLRTPKRGEWLKAQGRSRNGARSMHIFGLAADVICAAHRWRCPRSCGFFSNVGEVARGEGLTWGGDWTTIVDRPHVQLVRVGEQGTVRAAGVNLDTALRSLGYA